MEFKSYIPKKLKGISPLIWDQKTDSPKKWKMLPEFNIDLIFNLDKPWIVHTECYKNKSYNPTDNFCFLSGLHTMPHFVEFPRCHMFGIRLHTVAANLLFGLPCKELKNWAIDGDIIFSKQFNYIQDSVSSIPDFHSRAVWLEEFICTLLRHQADFGMAMKISSLLDKISIQKSRGKLCRVEDFTGYSRMHNLRIFQKWFGLAPTEVLSFRRFENTLNQIHCSTDNLTQIGLNSGYYDQAHFIRSFKHFAEMTPKQYLKNKTDLLGQLQF